MISRLLEFLKWAINLLFNIDKAAYFIYPIILAEGLICSLIISHVKYTEIDWVAYMQEVEPFLNKDLNYTNYNGQTGPCVYPAGFIYIYSILYKMTNFGKSIITGQTIFALLYMLFISLIFKIYHKSKTVEPIYYLIVAFTSYRIHSIFMLRLFNDCFASLFNYAFILLLISDRFTLAAVLLSLGISVKMNGLLFLPSFILISVYHKGIINTINNLSALISVQLILGSPFLFFDSHSYLARAFEFSREFNFKWTVNWRFLGEQLFLDKRFHLGLLAGHLFFIVVFSLIWIYKVKKSSISQLFVLGEPQKREVHAQHILWLVLLSNFTGILFSRSLHYQFYIWYYHTIPMIFKFQPYVPLVGKVGLILAIEYAWNVYPSTNLSSAILLTAHLIIFFFSIRSAFAKPKAAKGIALPKKEKKSKKL